MRGEGHGRGQRTAKLATKNFALGVRDVEEDVGASGGGANGSAGRGAANRLVDQIRCPNIVPKKLVLTTF